MDYECLRNCYIGERLWKEGRVYTLPVDMEKHPKNFRPVGQAPEPEVPQSVPEPKEKETNPLVCKVCNRECKSDLGLISHNRVHKKQEVSNGSS